ncbi:hypothetical protein ILT44_29810, partial [Microvirga sp. BT689]|uniref:hypothetical protein n=1 Tax=Microvirga arvi TaxID=2778731 RepID=UPI00194FE810
RAIEAPSIFLNRPTHPVPTTFRYQTASHIEPAPRLALHAVHEALWKAIVPELEGTSAMLGHSYPHKLSENTPNVDNG